MAVAHELHIVALKDFAIYAETHAVAKLVRDAIVAADGQEPVELERIRLMAQTITTVMAEAIRATDECITLRRLRQARDLLYALRHSIAHLYRIGLFSAPLFDEVMCTTARCDRVVSDVYHEARHRARWRLEGIPLEEPRL